VAPGAGLGEKRVPRAVDVALVTVVELINPVESSIGSWPTPPRLLEWMRQCTAVVAAEGTESDA
jgi:hypothetical protein